MGTFFAILSDLDEDRVVQLLKSIGAGGVTKEAVLDVIEVIYAREEK